MTSPGADKVQYELNISVTMRDGVDLATDVYRPDTDDRVPVIVARTPYGKNTEFAYRKAMWWVQHGYAFVWMDVRGRGDSAGEFRPHRDEAVDGYDTIEWAAAQPWCDGQVVTWGQSYLGYIQWLTALEQPPSLRAMIVYVPPSDPFVEWPTGVHLPMELCWFRLIDGRVPQYVEGIDWDAVYAHLPLLTMDERAGFHSTHWRDELTHSPSDTEYWGPKTYQSRFAELDIPTMHVTGWYDDVQPATFINFTRMTKQSPTERTRRGQRLVVGPWDHGLTRRRDRVLGPIDFGPGADFDLDGHELRFLDHYIKGRENGVDVEPRAQLFIMGRDHWRDEDEWPLARTEWTSLYLSSGGSANTRFGDGTLRWDVPTADESADTYRYDPADPVPYLTESTSHQIGGPDDYREIEERPDVLVYSTPVLDADLEVTGPVRLELYASSDAVDTDFTAKLVDVHPDGFCQRLADGIVRGRFREGLDQERFLQPGEVHSFEVHLWSTSQVFRAGHRIRLEISSSAFPKYDRNLNTGGPLATGVQGKVAENQVWHGAGYPSRLILPVIPGAEVTG
jgi:putative CocE/NonD family hydrolase